MREYYESIAELLSLEDQVKSEWRGANGHTLFEGRNSSLMASSYKKASCVHRSGSKYDLTVCQLMNEEETEEKKSDKKLSQELK